MIKKIQKEPSRSRQPNKPEKVEDPKEKVEESKETPNTKNEEDAIEADQEEKSYQLVKFQTPQYQDLRWRVWRNILVKCLGGSAYIWRKQWRLCQA